MGNGLKFLVVDDDQMTLDFALGALASLGYPTVSAMDGDSALLLVQEDRQIRGVMADMCLGKGPTGAQLARAALAIRPDLKVLLTSGAPRALQVARQDLPQHVGLLPKPYRRRDLADCLSRLL